jgi:hypothetical protein
MTVEAQLVLIICMTSILAFFSQEFSELIKKIFNIKGAKLVLPLAFASALVLFNNELVVAGLAHIEDHITLLFAWIMYIMPYKQYSVYVVLVLLLTILSVGPVILLNMLSIKKTHKPYAHPYLVSTLIWIICVDILVFPPIFYH